MKTIFFNTSNVLPVPSVSGGATESLLTFLIEENEKRKLMNFIIHCKYSEKAEAISKQYKFTQIYYYKSIKELGVVKSIFNKDFLSYFKYKLKKETFFSNLPEINRYYYSAYKIARRIKPDFFIAEGGLYEQYQYFLKDIDKKAMYAHLHREVEGNDKLWEIFPNAIAISNFIKNRYINSSTNKDLNVKLLYNCCDDIKFSELVTSSQKNEIIKKLGISKNDFVIVFSGRIIPEKGVIELIEALNKIERDNIKLIIIGSSLFAGAPESEYESLVKSKARQSKGKIVTTGFIHNSLLPIYFSISNTCVVPSIYEEPLALVPAEAMTSGLPTIISDSGGMKEYQKDNCLIVVERGDKFVDNLKDSILKLMDNPEYTNQLIKKGKERAKDFTREKFYANFCNLFLD